MTKPYKCRVEYLESTGTQYIDTGVMGNGEFNIKYGLYANSIGSSSDIFAGARSSTQHLNLGQAASNGQFTLGYLNQYWQELQNFAINTRYDIEISYKSGEQYAIINGTKGSSKTYTGTEQTDLTIYLFKRHHYGTDNVGGLQGRIYYFTIKQNDVLVRDFIPVLDNSGRPAMYDQVSGQLFYNQGSGEFTYGRQIIPVEYLESSGTQYIDTGVKGKNNLHYKTKINFTTLSTSGSNGIGGEYLANASAYIGMVRANGHYTYLFNNTAVETTTTIYANTDYVIDSTMNNGSQIVKVNNETISTGTLSGTFTSTRNIFLYAICSTNNAADVYGSLKMYYCQIYDNGVLVRDFIPCIDENLTPFMFDKVNCTVYLNAGTGQFKVGPNVEKSWGGKKLRKKLALALANLKKKRKYYCEVEYLETTNQQNNDTSTNNASYIDTGVLPDNTTKIECRAQFTTLISGNSNEALFGTTGVSSSDPARMAFGFASVSPYTNFYMGLGIQNLTTSVTRDTVVHTFTIDASASSWKIDDTTGTFSNPGEVIGAASIYLFARNYAAYQYANKPANARTYYCKIWKGGSLVRDMIPVLDWDMTPCMYDRVTEQLFYNQGTGSFVAGRQIHYVDYLESTGTQYINTGFKANTTTTKYQTKIEPTDITTTQGIFGSRNTLNLADTESCNVFIYQSQFRLDWVNGYVSGGIFVPIAVDTPYEIEMTRGRGVVNGVVYTSTEHTSENQDYNFLIGNFTNGSSTPFSGGFIGKIYYGKLYSNNVLVRDYIPAIDSNGTAFMFDRLSHTIYDNAGTGAFGYSAREVEYLESDGARAIVAGVTVDDTCGYDVKWMALNSNDTIILGTKGSGDSRWVLSGINNPNVNISWNTSSGGVGLGLNKIQTAQMNYLNDRKRILNDTPLADITTTLAAAASTYNVGIFGGYWGSSTISLYSTCRIYHAKISKGIELIRDFVPMVKDGSPCLFDKVGGLYYFGTGTGTFTTGRILEKEYE